MRNSVKVYDNGGTTCDRYTVVINSDLYGMSDNAMQPNGFNQYCGTIGENGQTAPPYASETRRNLSELPTEVKTAISLRVDSYTNED